MNAIEISSDRYTCELSAGAAPAVEVEPGSTLRVHCRGACDRITGRPGDRAPEANPEQVDTVWQEQVLALAGTYRMGD